MYVMDGGNSAKRMATPAQRRVGDVRQFTDSDYLLPRPFVDRFAHEVKTSELFDDTTDNDDEQAALDGAQTDPVSLVNAADCSKTWKAAASEDKKRMWGIFDETGIFVSACRHGLLLWYADMVKSGELYVTEVTCYYIIDVDSRAKYPLAMVAKVLEVLGERTLGAYDIGCGFSKTVLGSSLGPTFVDKQSRLCVDAFHGYAHNYICQSVHHPLVIEGAGLEDFGTSERIFSASNALAPVIRHASAYRRHAFLDLFFKQWDEDKYANLGTMILNNYRQAQHIISTESLALAEAKISLGIGDEDLDKWRREELEYLNNLGQEPESDVLAGTYVELLQELRDAE
jgi:hypothetical protein